MRRTDAKNSKKRYFRAGDRIVNENSAWYFSAREGELGPFQTRSDAEREVQRFLFERQQLSNFQGSRQQPTKETSTPALKQVPKPAPKAVAKRVQVESCAQQRRHHLEQMVESDALMLTLDVDFQL